MENIKIWTLDNEKAVLIIDGEMVNGRVEYFRGRPTIITEDGRAYNPNQIA
jgi:hypothetical protein